MVGDEAAAPRVTTLGRAGQYVVAVAVGIVAAVAAVHIAAVILYVAPENAVSRTYGDSVDEYVKPEFVQNWKLFAPEPLHVNVRIYARTEVRTADGSSQVMPWVDITAADIEQTRGNLLPSHTRNQLRKGWRSYTRTHDSQNRAENITGLVVESYLKRVALLRLEGSPSAGPVLRVQLRADTTPVVEPAWSGRRNSGETTHRILPWWSVGAADFPDGGVR